MKMRISQNIAAGWVFLGALGLVEVLWVRGLSIFGLLAVWFGSTWVLAWTQRPVLSEVWPRLQAPEPQLSRASTTFPSRGRMILYLVGLLFVGLAYRSALRNEQINTFAAVLFAAIFWHPLIDSRTHSVPVAWLGVLSFAVMVLAALFRLTQAGSVPVGMIHWDEPLIYEISRDVVMGKREIYNSLGSDGQFPYWTNAAAIHFFGHNILGFRLAGILSGIVSVGLIMLVGKEIGGSRLGLLAGAFTAVAYWPVAFSRAEYLLASSYLPVLGCLWLLLYGLRRGSPLALAFSGLCFGACFSIYNGGKIVPLILVLLGSLIWWREKISRRALAWAIVPFVGGTLIALAPLLLWVAHTPQHAYQAYFGKLNNDWIAGADVVAAQGFGARLQILLGRIVPNFDRMLPMFTITGDRDTNFYFLLGQPVIDRSVLFLLFAGMATCLVRFRKPTYAVLLCWWFLGFLPALVATPQYWPSPRRIMMSMPATMLLSGVGLLTLFEILSNGLKSSLSNRLALIGVVVFFGWFAPQNWKTYFVTINKNASYLATSEANFVNGVRAVVAENEKSPIYLINFRKNNADLWLTPSIWRGHESRVAFLNNIPRENVQEGPVYFKSGGIFGALERVPTEYPDKKSRDPLVLLTPFHFYLEPLLVKELGGERVAEIMPEESNTGTDWTDFGFAPHVGATHRLIRLKNFDRTKLRALKERWALPFIAEEITPPAAVGTRAMLIASSFDSPLVLKAYSHYERNPKAWKASAATELYLADAYFWCIPGSLATLPMRLRASWTLTIPRDGLYALGASSTEWLSLRVDGKQVYQFTPDSGSKLQAAVNGSVGMPLPLKAGPHRLDLEQIALTANPVANQALRLVWQNPDGKLETLPLDALTPARPTLTRKP